MAVTYKKLFHLLIDRGVQPSELTELAGFSANILTRLRREQYVSLESIERICRAFLMKVVMKIREMVRRRYYEQTIIGRG